MPEYDKPFKTYAEQIERLKSVYRLEINNDEFAEYALTAFSYYDLINGYQELFMSKNTFHPGVSIQYLTFFYLYDKEFQNFIFRYSLFIESTFKNKLAYILSSAFGVAQEDYLANYHYHYSYKNKIFLYQVKADIIKHSTKLSSDGTRKYTQQPSKHYAEKHNHIPAWILLKNVTFADAISLYKLLKKEEKTQVSNAMLSCPILGNDKTAFLIPALDLIRNYRNIIAHNLKFTTYTCPKYPLPLKISKKILADTAIFQGRKTLCDIYACLLAIYILLDNPFMKIQFLKDLQKVYDFKPLPQDEANKAFLQIRHDYFTVTNLENNIHSFLSYCLKQLPQKSPFT